jgi:hypothetical protein
MTVRIATVTKAALVGAFALAAAAGPVGPALAAAVPGPSTVLAAIVPPGPGGAPASGPIPVGTPGPTGINV